MTKRLVSTDYKRKIDSDFRLAEIQDPEIQALMAKFLCVRIGGYIEAYIKERICNFVSNRKSHKVITSYIQTAIRNITNLNNKKLIEFLKSFSSEWAEYYTLHVTQEMTSSLGSVYNLRNNIAHGGNDSLSLMELKKHFGNIEQLLIIVDKAISK